VERQWEPRPIGTETNEKDDDTAIALMDAMRRHVWPLLSREQPSQGQPATTTEPQKRKNTVVIEFLDCSIPMWLDGAHCRLSVTRGCISSDFPVRVITEQA
jgi:hypothetical protein